MRYNNIFLIAPQGTCNRADVTSTSYSVTHVNNNICDSSDTTHAINNNEDSSTCAATDTNISAFNGNTMKDNIHAATCDSNYTIHDANRGNILEACTGNIRTIVSITNNGRYCAATNCSTNTHNTTVTNKSVSTSANVVAHESPSCNDTVSIGRTRSRDNFGSILNMITKIIYLQSSAVIR